MRPSGLVSQNIIAANASLYASVTICTPGEAMTACPDD